MTMAMWLFVVLVLTQIYTANLASILTTQALEPTVTDIESLQYSNAKVGHTRASFVKRYLVDVLHFNPQNMKNYTSPEALANDLRNREVAAIFLEVPVAKLFLARYCKSFTMAGPTYKVGGYGFVILLLTSFAILSPFYYLAKFQLSNKIKPYNFTIYLIFLKNKEILFDN